MRFVVVRKIKRARVLYVDREQVLVAHGLRLVMYENGEKKRVVAKLSASFTERLFSIFTFTRLGLRMGIHAAQPLCDGRILVVLKRRFVLIDQDGSSRVVDRVHRGNKPASKALCQIPDGTVLYGEYFLNKNREIPVALYRTENPVLGFRKIFEFSAGEVRHIHFVQWDPFEACLWMGTGDADAECNLFKSTDTGESWSRIGGGSQDWRAVGVIFTTGALFWGTDAGSDADLTPNYIIRFDRITHELSKIQRIQGPCHGSGVLSDGTMFISTGVEGGKNELDASAHLWASRDGYKWREVYARPKKKWPHIVQFGVMRIPPGTETTDALHFNALALRGAAETWYSGTLYIEES
ncbi:hypothetical protein EST62_04965 [Chlorobaculum sp. 24CR]|uniref:hypothetical protein n=1 Tax=Chlorobaculum sp. 24CR TaxID=2508878 RepID=UPI00100A278C|nr:hypothetical protein [Chlorobaculum sp. 24CR]RXK88052.1 hypothetical protein EST62_04965 [Chlorobaculum sp. 24CR]